MSKISELRSCNDLTSLARLLNFSPSALSYIIYKIPDDDKYQSKEIAKKSGGIRQLLVPCDRLKAVQRQLAALLSECESELQKQRMPLPSNADPCSRSIAHGFKKGHSIASNARRHKNKSFVFNIDLKDFFPSINFGRVYGFFQKSKDYGLNKKVSAIIAQIACYKNCLPQGSPTSPVLSNMICHMLDIRLAQLSMRHKCYYTRYADDLTFSTSVKEFPIEIARRVGDDYVVGDILRSEIMRAGFIINDNKTRMQFKPSRQTVTGLVVNQKVNVPRELVKASRAMCFRLFRDGSYNFPYIKKDRPHSNPKIVHNTGSIEALLGYIYFVKSYSIEVELRRKPGRVTAEIIDREMLASSVGKLRSDLLFYKYFISNSKPTIVCEGKTDNIYLKCALDNLPALRGQLKNKNAKNESETAIHFLKFTRPVVGLLNLGTGEGNIKKFIEKYSKRMEGFNHKPLHNPVIILIDNDDGAKEIFSYINKNCDVKVSHTTTNSFYYLCDNLYLVKTPEMDLNVAGSEKGYSYIEKLFHPDLLKRKVGTATFNLKKKHNADNEYGKEIFAQAVVKEDQRNIDFSGFVPLLNRISSVVEHYAKQRQK